MSENMLERLAQRERAYLDGWFPGYVLEDAALDAWAKAEISRLTARIEELEKALKPFADFRYELVIEAVDGDPNKPIFDIEKGDGTLICCLTSVDFEFARSTLEASDRNGGTK